LVRACRAINVYLLSFLSLGDGSGDLRRLLNGIGNLLRRGFNRSLSSDGLLLSRFLGSRSRGLDDYL